MFKKWVSEIEDFNPDNANKTEDTVKTQNFEHVMENNNKDTTHKTVVAKNDNGDANTILKESKLIEDINVTCDLALSGDVEGTITSQQDSHIIIEGTSKGNTETREGDVYIEGELQSWNITEDSTDRKRIENQLKESLREKELLLKEVHHRVKNNMQVISSLLNLQSRYVKGKRNIAIFNESQNRIKSMALVHEKLYQSKDLTTIDLNDYLESLADGLLTFYKPTARNISCEIEADSVTIGSDTAVPFGLIINELLSNSLKHAFSEHKNGAIKIIFRIISIKEDIEYELIVSDNGIGLPEDLDIRKTKSLGLQLITSLAEHQLQGRLELNRNNGTEFRFRFKKLKYIKRI
jgi:two-component sensor histidine kinase